MLEHRFLRMTRKVNPLLHSCSFLRDPHSHPHPPPMTALKPPMTTLKLNYLRSCSFLRDLNPGPFLSLKESPPFQARFAGSNYSEEVRPLCILQDQIQPYSIDSEELTACFSRFEDLRGDALDVPLVVVLDCSFVVVSLSAPQPTKQKF